MDALLASVSALADLDTDNDAAVVKMGKKASWQASVIGKLEHTLYLVQFVSLQSQAILADKEGYIQPIKPAVSAIQQALRTADPAQIATAYASFQPNILKLTHRKFRAARTGGSRPGFRIRGIRGLGADGRGLGWRAKARTRTDSHGLARTRANWRTRGASHATTTFW